MLPIKTLLLLLLVSTICSGCWDRKELKTLAIIAGSGIDRTPDGKFITSFQFINVGQVQGGGGGNGGTSSGGKGGGPEAAFWTTKGEMKTAFGSARIIRFQVSRTLYLSQIQVLIIGKEAARQGIRETFDHYARYPLIRLTEMILIAKGTASEVLEATANPLDKIPATSLVSMVNITADTTAQIIPIRHIELFKLLISKTQAGVIPQVEVATQGKKKTLRLDSSAVIKNGRIIGELTRNETRGVSWVLGKTKRALLEITDRSGKGLAALEVFHAVTKLQPELHGKQVVIKARIRTEANLVNLTVLQNWLTPEKLELLGKTGSSLIRQDITASWHKARRFKADIYGFGELISRRYPRRWKNMEPNWDRIFPQIKFIVQVETNISKTSELIKPLLPQ